MSSSLVKRFLMGSQDAYTILWSDLMVLKRRLGRYLLTTLISPLLYLVAFGWGLGRGMSVNGTSYLEFVVPGIIALTAMTTSFNGAGTRLNVDRLYFRSFDECLMAPIGLLSLLLGKAFIGVVRGLISSFAFIAVAMLLAPGFHIGALFFLELLLTCLVFSFPGRAGRTAGQVSSGSGHLQQPDTAAHDLPGRNLLLPIPGACGI